MTENEAISYLRMATDEAGNAEFSDLYKEMCNMAIQALEEIQQYRAIGLTPEQIEAMQGHNIALINDLGEYQAIGTVEEFKALKDRIETKKVAYQGEHEKCPACGSFHVFGNFCTECGQALNWGE